jgi:acyl CoA:acetate/3-ketoacid CoA transferase alpha subunit
MMIEIPDNANDKIAMAARKSIAEPEHLWTPV